MENFDEAVERVAGNALCQFLSNAGSQALQLTAIAIAEPTPVGDLIAAGAWVAAYAARKNCTWDPNAPGTGLQTYTPFGCKKANKNCLALGYGPGQSAWISGFAEFVSLVNTGRSGGYGTFYWRATGKKLDGTLVEEEFPRSQEEVSRNILWMSGDSCECVDQTVDPGFHLETDTDYTIYDNDTECTFNVRVEGWAVGASNQTTPVYAIAPGGSDFRNNGGGIIRGCNFQPFIYAPDGGGPGGPNIPIPPNPTPGPGGEPWWAPLVRGALQGAASLATQELIKALINPRLEPSNFTFIAPCDKNEDGSPAEVIYQFPEQPYQSRVISHQAVIMEILQQHLNWKTPICREKTLRGAYPRSITFASDENTDRGNRRCVKRFGYRSMSPGDVSKLYSHWRCFEWVTGPVIVSHSGSTLGNPQVWARDIDEGKRVILHAGIEAGVNPDKVGEWSISSSDNPRYGVQRTVKLMECKGIWQATARQGSDGHAEAIWTGPGL